jgi:hypothetical protein
MNRHLIDMLCSLNDLYDNICEFLAEFAMDVNNEDATLTLKYMFMHYDLIDVDLDFDEQYYYEMRKRWEHMLENTVSEMINEGCIKNARIYRKLQITRKESNDDKEWCYSICNDGRIEVVTKEYRGVSNVTW